MITAQGLGTGLDIASIVDTLVAAERAPQESRLNRLESRANARLSAYGELKSALSTLRDALNNLNGDDFRRRLSANPRDDLVGVTADPGAPLGTYGIEVVSLASAHRLTSKAYDDLDDVIGTGSLDITVNGETMELTIDSSSRTVAGVRDAINNAEDNPGVLATVITADDGVHLVLSSTESGEDFEMEVDGSGGGNRLGALDFNPSRRRMTEQSPAQDAQIEVDGFTVSSSNNSIGGAVPGLTFDILAADPGETFDVSVSEDVESSKQAVQDFVDAWNAAQETLRTLTAYDPVNQVGSELMSDSLTRGLRESLRREVSAVIGEGDIRMLADVGIQGQLDGSLTLDTVKLDEALAADASALVDLFTGDEGMATRLDTILDPYLGTGGFIDVREDTLADQLESVEDQRVRLDLRIDQVRLRLQDQFAAMDALVAQLNSTGSFLLQQLGSG